MIHSRDCKAIGLAYLCYKKDLGLRRLSLIYMLALDAFLLWHILSCYGPHLYPPILVTFFRLFLTPKWLYTLYDPYFIPQ